MKKLERLRFPNTVAFVTCRLELGMMLADVIGEGGVERRSKS
jgi:hypothetical protein